MSLRWQWQERSEAYANYGNANQWTVNAGLGSLGRESAQNTNDARLSDEAELVFTFIRLTGRHREQFEDAIRWAPDLRPHLAAMAGSAAGAVSAGQIKRGLEDLEASDSLLLLRVADYNCTGLTGPEFPKHNMPEEEFGNFIKLCRLDLFSGKEKGSGGSFGLGKAVYWRFSRVQTALFNTVLQQEDAVDGKWRDRIFGVNQGVVHNHQSKGFEGRGFFGVAPDDTSPVASVWEDAQLADSLYLTRQDDRPGTTALLMGFYDPDRPDLGETDVQELENKLVPELALAVESDFWPLLARGRLRVRIEIVENGEKRYDYPVEPAKTYPELVRALHRFDRGERDDRLDAFGNIVVRDIPIRVSERKDESPHPAFDHVAKLVVTLSDDEKDSLENRVVLFRSPEMLVETVDKAYDNITYHAFLVAGAAITPGSPAEEQLRADDFLRFAEPPAHDRWIPGRKSQSSQANLTARYKAPWLGNLRGIEEHILRALEDIFEPPPAETDAPPESILKHLRFLSGATGSSGAGGGAPRKPTVDILSASIEDNSWHVTFSVRVKNREEGWSLKPWLAFRGLDGTRQKVEWVNVSAAGEGRWADDRLVIAHKPNRRFLKAVVTARSTADLPIPADEAAIEIVTSDIAPADGTAGGGA